MFIQIFKKPVNFELTFSISSINSFIKCFPVSSSPRAQKSSASCNLNLHDVDKLVPVLRSFNWHSDSSATYYAVAITFIQLIHKQWRSLFEKVQRLSAHLAVYMMAAREETELGSWPYDE